MKINIKVNESEFCNEGNVPCNVYSLNLECYGWKFHNISPREHCIDNDDKSFIAAG
jgi:hypothetical protein